MVVCVCRIGSLKHIAISILALLKLLRIVFASKQKVVRIISEFVTRYEKQNRAAYLSFF